MQEEVGYWCFCMKYIQEKESDKHIKKGGRRNKPDYKELLDDHSFRRFSAMRVIRKRIAQEEAIPAYAVFTDAVLAEIAKLGTDYSLSEIKKVDGIGTKKADKYGHHFLPDQLNL